jgi:hypothetical protein
LILEYIFEDGTNLGKNTGTLGAAGDLTPRAGGVVTQSSDTPRCHEGGNSGEFFDSTAGATTDLSALEGSATFDPFAGAEKFSILTWVRRTATGTSVNAFARMMEQGGDHTGTGVSFRFTSGGPGLVVLGVRGEKLTGSPSATGVLVRPTDSNWHHVAATYDGTMTANNVQFLLDGAREASCEPGLASLDAGAVKASLPAPEGSTPLQIDQRIFRLGNGYANATSTAPNRGLRGKLHDFMIFRGVALTQAEIQCYAGFIKCAAEKTITEGDAEPSFVACHNDSDPSLGPVTTVECTSGPFGVGEHTITCTAKNSGGCVIGTCTTTLTVKPAFACNILWHKPLPPGAGSHFDEITEIVGFTCGQTIPIQVHVEENGLDITADPDISAFVSVQKLTANCDTDAGEIEPEFNGVGGDGGQMVLVDGHLKYNLNTKALPCTEFKCYRITVTVTKGGTEGCSESVTIRSRK